MLIDGYRDYRNRDWFAVPRRLRFAYRYYGDKLGRIPAWAWEGRELDNFTYDLTDKNKGDLAAMIAVVTGAPPSAVRTYLDEPEQELGSHYGGSNGFGRRLGWYAIVRIAKPRIVIETGVHRGLGAAVLCAALKRNAEEGHEGRYYGTDINTGAGDLLLDPWRQFGEILYGDSIASLEAFRGQVDLFINDSDHSAEYEYREYRTILPKLSDRAILLADNAHVSESLRRFSEEEGRKYLFFREEPREHWYPGGGIGVSFR